MQRKLYAIVLDKPQTLIFHILQMGMQALGLLRELLLTNPLVHLFIFLKLPVFSCLFVVDASLICALVGSTLGLVLLHLSLVLLNEFHLISNLLVDYAVFSLVILLIFHVKEFLKHVHVEGTGVKVDLGAK